MTEKTTTNNYTPLHHKYRPQRFDQLVGQRFVAATLTAAVERKLIAPAYLLHGSRGTGKTSTARIMAKSLNCLSSTIPTAAPCGQCEMCKAIERSSALDVTEIDAASNNGVDFARDLVERSHFRPIQGRYKVFIVDEAHQLTAQAQNALLKTLEEPPAQVVFILATTEPHRLLETIRSRCQQYNFKRLGVDDIVGQLRDIADAENIDTDDDALRAIAVSASGGLRDSEALLDTLATRGRVSIDDVYEAIGRVTVRDVVPTVKASASGDVKQTLTEVRKVVESGLEVSDIVSTLITVYRHLLVIQSVGAAGAADLVQLPAETFEALAAIANDFDWHQLRQGIDRLKRSEFELTKVAKADVWLEVLTMQLAEPVAAAIPSVPAVPPQPAPAVRVTKSAESADFDDDEPATPSAPASGADDLAAQVAAVVTPRMLATFVKQSKITVNGDRVTVKHKVVAIRKKLAANDAAIAEAVATVLKRQVQVEVA